MKFKNLYESLKWHWASLNIDINIGVSEASLKSFEAKYELALPEDFRSYFLCVNGMPPQDVDDEMFRFWMLEEVKPLSHCATEYANPTYIQNPESLFLFADYSMWGHAYAIRLTNTLESNKIFIIGYEPPISIFDSFSEFVDAYLTNKDLLF
jgi:hypothetical protein